jgi:hypothetical protein
VLYFSTCFSTWFRNCSDSVVFFFMISELLWQCCIFLHYTVRTVQKSCRKYYTVRTGWKSSRIYYTVRTVPKSYRKIQHCQNSIISELFWQCCFFLHVFFLHDFGTVLTMWYFSTWFRNCSDSVVFPTWFLNCSDSVVFPTWILNCSDSVVFPTSFLNYSDSVVFFYMFVI